MPFYPLSTLPEMQEIYRLPRSPERFTRYLALLQGGTKADLRLPISGFNPMANAYAAGRLDELIDLDAPGILTTELSRINALPAAQKVPATGVGLNLADDLGGAWTNRPTTDYASKFTLNALVSRNFCAPFFWTSEPFSQAMIAQRIREYALRTIYWYQHGKPQTLKEHVLQENYALSTASPEIQSAGIVVPTHLAGFFAEDHASTDDHLIFAFLYGDAAAEPLGYKTYGVKQGFFG